MTKLCGRVSAKKLQNCSKQGFGCIVLVTVLGQNCFALPYTFDCHSGGPYLGKGKDGMHGDTFCDIRSRTNCPFFPRRYWCGKNYTRRILEEMKTTFGFEPTAFSGSVSSWADILANKRALFIGDSVHSHLAFSLMCLMNEHTDRKRHPLVSVYKKAKRLPFWSKEASRKYFCVKLPKLNSSICYDRTNTSHKILQKMRIYRQMMAESAYVVMNFGLHNPSLDISAFAKLLSLLKLPSSTQLIWKETAPQHFANPGGVFSREKLGVACAKIDEFSFDKANAINMAYEKVTSTYRLPTLRIWNDTRPFHQAHAVGECTHYCEPGIPDYWVEKLRVLLLEK
ncbi:hypothetical protein RI054_16g76250 [Pseudoscourfieldia marina]